jgi:hypothetical protein
MGIRKKKKGKEASFYFASFPFSDDSMNDELAKQFNNGVCIEDHERHNEGVDRDGLGHGHTDHHGQHDLALRLGIPAYGIGCTAGCLPDAQAPLSFSAAKAIEANPRTRRTETSAANIFFDFISTSSLSYV